MGIKSGMRSIGLSACATTINAQHDVFGENEKTRPSVTASTD
jgi:hypothetical protein